MEEVKYRVLEVELGGVVGGELGWNGWWLRDLDCSDWN